MIIVFAGTPQFAVPSLEFLINSKHRVRAVYTQPDRAAGRGRQLTVSAVKLVAQNHHIPVFQPVSFETVEARKELKSLKPDLLVVVAYGLILPQAVLDIPRLGCINVHASLLPRWRGAAPIQRAIEAGDAITGITIMQVEEGLDTGPMLKKIETSIVARENAGELHDRLAKLGARALSETLPEIETETIEPEIQDESQVTYAKKIDKGEAKIDWSDSAIGIERRIRAFNPWPVAQTQYNGQWLRIWRAEASPKSAESLPGIVVSENRKFLEVATGYGVLKVLELQLPGGKRISTQAFLNAHKVDGVLLG